MDEAFEVAPRSRHRSVWFGRAGLGAVTVVRLLLGLGMIPYALSKLVYFQFQVAASDYALPLANASGITLTWAFLGYSPVFQVLLGVFELVPALLLFSARTRRFGALLMFPVLLNVVLINYHLNLWPQTQLISEVLLALNVFLLAYDWRLYRDLLAKLVVHPTPFGNRKVWQASHALGFLVPAVLVGGFVFTFRSQIAEMATPISDFTGERQINRAGSWRVESMRVGGQTVPKTEGDLMYFDFSRRCVYAVGAKRNVGKFSVDRRKHSFTIANIPFGTTNTAVKGNYRVDADRLFLDGESEGKPVNLVLARTRWGRWRP